jgi:hypothetical protein
MNCIEFELANESAIFEAIKEARDYTVIGFIDFDLICFVNGSWISK